MILRLVIEASPSPQAQMERVFDGGRLVIGRSDEADWQLDDPNMYLSRRHCILTEEGGQVMATDASSGGLFIDNAANPIGTGNSVPVEPGMRLHLGDFVLRIEAASASVPADEAAPEKAKPGVGFSFEFGSAPPPEEPAERPASLPDPFGLRRDDAPNERHKEVSRAPRPLDQDDPFGLDLRSPFGPDGDKENALPPKPDVVLPFPEKQGNGGTEKQGIGGYFGGGPTGPRDTAAPEAEAKPAKPDLFGDWNKPVTPPTPPVSAPSLQTPPEPEEKTEPPGMALFDNFDLPDDDDQAVDDFDAERLPETKVTNAPQPMVPKGMTDPGALYANAPEDTAPPRPVTDVTPPPAPRPAAKTAGDVDLRDALLRGMGIDPASMPSDDPAAEMEHLGRCMRDMVEGVMLLLRTRAQEKQKVRVAQTIIASADVNPLKFLATPEDACAALLKPRGKGYLAPEKAVRGAFRDLADHQVRTWSALQIALRRMIDTFDPKEIEKEMADVGMLESLIAGGRSAKLWQLYEERYRDIAESAEKQFLGEVGADFRDAYEKKGS